MEPDKVEIWGVPSESAGGPPLYELRFMLEDHTYGCIFLKSDQMPWPEVEPRAFVVARQLSLKRDRLPRYPTAT